MEKGTIFKFHNDLDTDQIIASQYLLLPNLEEMKSHTFESLDPENRAILSSAVRISAAAPQESRLPAS